MRDQLVKAIQKAEESGGGVLLDVGDAKELLFRHDDLQTAVEVVLPEWYSLASANQKNDEERASLEDEYNRYKKLIGHEH